MTRAPGFKVGDRVKYNPTYHQTFPNRSHDTFTVIEVTPFPSGVDSDGNVLEGEWIKTEAFAGVHNSWLELAI